MKNKQKGFTLVELSLAIVGGFIVTLGVFAGYLKYNDNARVKQTLEDFGGIFAAAQNWKVGKADFAGLTIGELDTQGLTPNTVGNGTASNEWGGDYTAGPMIGDPTRLTITATAADTAPCLQIADKLNSSASPATATCNSGTITANY